MAVILRLFQLVQNIQCWRNTHQLDCRKRPALKWIQKINVYCCFFQLPSKPQMWWFDVVDLQRTARNCSKVRAARVAQLFKVRAARAARVFFLVPPIRFMSCADDVAVRAPCCLMLYPWMLFLLWQARAKQKRNFQTASRADQKGIEPIHSS